MDIKNAEIGFEKALFIAIKLKAEFVYNMAKLEGNTVTYAQAETIVYGKTPAGLSIQEVRQVDNINKAWSLLIDELNEKDFRVTKQNAIHFNMLAAESENKLGYGGFRTGVVAISGTDYKPPMPLELNIKWDEMIDDFNNIEDPAEQSLFLYATMSRTQFFGDGNKRTALMMMNGNLIMNGMCPITISPERDAEYRQCLLDYYEQPAEHKNKFYEFLKNEQKVMLKKWGYELNTSSKTGETIQYENKNVAKTKLSIQRSSSKGMER